MENLCLFVYIWECVVHVATFSNFVTDVERREMAGGSCQAVKRLVGCGMEVCVRGRDKYGACPQSVVSSRQ